MVDDVRQNPKWGYIDQAGNVVIEPAYSIAYGFQDGLAPVEKDGFRKNGVRQEGKWGYINRTGEVVTPLSGSTMPKYLKKGWG